MTTKVLLIAGTWGSSTSWLINRDDLFQQMLRSHGLEPMTDVGGGPFFNWHAKLGGLWWNRLKGWTEESARLFKSLEDVPYKDRNIIAHSHGGQLPIFAAAWGLPIRTLVTVGTPRRADVPAEQAVNHIGWWAHMHDADRDWMATLKRRTLGGLGDWRLSTERRFLVPGVQNIPIVGVSHSKLFSDPSAFHYWAQQHVLESIKNGPVFDHVA